MTEETGETGFKTQRSIEQLVADAVNMCGLPTDDALKAMLALIRQVSDCHAAEMVAPLEGLGALEVDSGRVFFSVNDRQPFRNQDGMIAKVQSFDVGTLEVVADVRESTGQTETKDLRVARSDEQVHRPVYVSGFVSWEHLLEHHDPLTDVFCLGQLLASLACGLDFCEEADVERFATHRGNLFALKADLHPVVAQTIYQMTELDRGRRVQDLLVVTATLENYRDATTSIEFDPEFAANRDEPTETKNEKILRSLRQRLFDTSRRNRLLHFSPTMATINLTQASVPLSLDPKNIGLDKLLLADDQLLDRLGDGKTISLTGYIDVQEVLYAPNVLDRIITDDRRDRAEYGFGGLRLAMAFLNWSNVKVTPAENYNSPLVLVGVVLKKKKGVRDKYLLEAVSDFAEVNPVVRHLMRQLYDIELPESIPLKPGAIADLASDLRQKISASDNSIRLDVVDRPQIELIHAKAEKRLALYKKRARVSGRGVRHFEDLQYSYDAANYHPLGVRIFENYVRFSGTNLEAVTRRKPAPIRHNMVAQPSEPPSERTLYRWKEGGTGNPYHWQIDLCNITLASFKYRRMSLVRDYDVMIQDPIENKAFETLFSATPREQPRSRPIGLAVAERFDVVPCDPTQAIAISQAREGTNYIVQGPPGTGKSQTITNLIADFVARGKRVLFVCEKRAAIDVVYARLKAIGLGPVSCLIHDSQADKKEFVADLRATYELFMSQANGQQKSKRSAIENELRTELERLESVNTIMNQNVEDAGMTLIQLLDRCIDLDENLPDLDDLERERLPTYAEWSSNRNHLAAITEKMKVLREDAVTGRHPLSILKPSLAKHQQPLALVKASLEKARRALDGIKHRYNKAGLSDEAWATNRLIEDAVEYAEAALPLAEAGLMDVVEVGNKISAELNEKVRQLRQHRIEVTEVAAKNNHWIQKLSPEDTTAALGVARDLEDRFSRIVSPAWWRLRSMLKRSYNLKAHAVRPKWKMVLNNLNAEHEKAAVAQKYTEQLLAEYSIDEDPLSWPSRISRIMRIFNGNEQLRSLVHRPIMRGSDPVGAMKRIVETKALEDDLENSLDVISDSWRDLALHELVMVLPNVEAATSELPRFLTVMESVAELPGSLSWAVRQLPLSLVEIEAAIADRTYHAEVCRHPAVESYSGGTRTAHAVNLASIYARWQKANSEEALNVVAKRFVDHVDKSDDPTPTTREERNERRSYKKGRRELEHEFGKQMRFKPIRSLLSGDCGRVVTDLKPVWLMSPLSVSDTLPMVSDVDVVIFDEASQVTLEDAVPSLCRGKQVIVVGDQMQLPPTNFFAMRGAGEDEELSYEDTNGEEVSYNLSSASFLEFSDRSLASTMLGWHYRSRSESLISFSNWRFYNGRLLTVPEEQLPRERDNCTQIASIDDADSAAEMLLERSISFHLLEHGCYESRRNRAEAEHIARLVRSLLCDQENTEMRSDRLLPKNPTIGVIAFSEAQQSEIESAMNRLAEEDPDFAARLNDESVRHEEEQFVGLLVKNLENIQGDERDIILLSVCYGPDPNGRTRMNFGPINKSGGEKRLNVAFSRAKHHMAVISSMRHTDITNDYNTGAATLRDYLQYAESHSAQRFDEATSALGRLSHRSQIDSKPVPDSALQKQLVATLTDAGWEVDQHVGQSHFRINLAIKRPGDSKYRLGIMLDDSAYQSADLFERDVQRPRLLEAFGWKITYVLAKDWYADPLAELNRIDVLTR